MLAEKFKYLTTLACDIQHKNRKFQMSPTAEGKGKAITVTGHGGP
jgi:hypothetical protein